MESRFLTAHDLSAETVATIDRVDREALATIMHLRGLKPLILDGHAEGELARAFMSPDKAHWSGRSVVLSAIRGEVAVRADTRPARIEPDHLAIKGEGVRSMMI
jgi:hypothetical protein